MAGDDFPRCPRCSHVIDMSDSDTYCDHTSYWADGDETRPHTCRSCDFDFHLKEHVSRHWTAETKDPADGR